MSKPRSTDEQALPAEYRNKRLLNRMGDSLEEFLVEINWLHVAFKILASCWTAIVIWLAWWTVLGFNNILSSNESSATIIKAHDTSKYFTDYAGYSECGINAADLYSLPMQDENGFFLDQPFCSTREELLHALSGGGRIGFDSQYISRGCHYRWFTTSEICFVLDRFDSVIFVGDSFLQTIYNGLSILLRRSLVSGALKQETAEDSVSKQECRCNNQFVKQACSSNYITSSKEASDFYCKRTAHNFLQASTGSISQTLVNEFERLIPHAPRSNYKPIPIVVSLSPSTTSKQEATSFLLKILELADASKRETPILWVGPTAAGHIEIRGRKGNQEIWDFGQHMARIAAENDIEVLGMWNMTVQASSWDGIHFGEKVALVQAMMVINWMSRLESS